MEQRSKTIDILRAVAVFLVLGRHLVPCPVEVSPFFHRISELWFCGGWAGVDLFFVLSGFLVSGLLFREHEKFGCIYAKRFLVRRGFKIYPPFWLLISATIAVMAFRHHKLDLKAMVSELLFVQNYGPALWTHTWSLAVEEHFYLLLLLFLLLLSGRCPTAKAFRSVPAAFAILAILCLALRVFTPEIAPSHLRMDSLFAGVFISYLYHFSRDSFLNWSGRHRLKLLLVGTLLFFPAFIFPLGSTPLIITAGFTLLYVGSGFLLIAALVTPVPRRGPVKALAYAGSHSYSIYLWHMPVAMWAVPKVNRILGTTENWFVYAGVYLIGSVFFGILLAALVEFPVLRVRDHLFPSRGRPLTASGTKPNEEEKNLPSPPPDHDAVTLKEPQTIQLESDSATFPDGLALRVAARDPESNG
jgi:peptidoglycan/LPS O-acetylase OafA/YrhL